MATDTRFLAESGREIFNGNELLVKGCLEIDGGVHLLTGYPGSPVANFFDILGDIKDLIQKNGIRAFQANNEALGVGGRQWLADGALPGGGRDEKRWRACGFRCAGAG